MKQYYTDKTPLNLLSVMILILASCIIGVTYYFLYFIPWLQKILIGIVALAAIWTALIWLPIYFRKASFLVSSKELITSTGFLWRTRRVMKASAVQYTTLITLPFSRKTGFNFLVVSALGGTIILPFLSRKDADEIARKLSPLSGERSDGKERAC